MNVRCDATMVAVYNNNIEQALRVFNDRMNNSGIFHLLKRKRGFIKPSEQQRQRRQQRKYKRKWARGKNV